MAGCASLRVVVLPRWLPLAAALLLAGCTTIDVKVVTLSGVVRGGKALPEGQVPADAVRLTRAGADSVPAVGMALQPGDALATSADTSLVISYPGGARAYVYPASRVRIGSIVDEIGKVFVKVRGLFNVRTTFVTAGSEGTQYWVDVKQPDQVRIVVVEDTVRLSSNAGAWPERRMKPGEAARLGGSAGPAMEAATPAEIQREVDWVKDMDALVPVQTAVSPWAIGAGAAAVGIGIWQYNKNSSGGGGGNRRTPSSGSSTGTPSTPPPAPAPAPTPAPAPPPAPAPTGPIVR